MSSRSQDVLVAVFDAFRGAVRDRDATAAESLCTEAGWVAREDGSGRYFRRVSRSGAVVGDARGVRHDDRRGAVRFDEGGDRFALFARDPDKGWRIEAVTESAARSGLYLRGALGPLVTFKELPASEAAAAWGRAVVGAAAAWTPDVWPDGPTGAAAVEKLRALASARGVRVERLGSAALDAVGRAAVGLSFARRGEAADEVWAVLDRDPSSRLVLHHLMWVPTVDALVEGVALPWTGDPSDVAPPEPPVPDAKAGSKRGFTADQIDFMLGLAAGRLTEAGGGAEARDLANDVRRRVKRRLVADTPKAPAPPPLTVDVASAIEGFVAQKAGADAVIDRKFVAEHGRGLLGAMMGAFAKALVPPAGGSSSADPPTGAANAPTVDLGDLVRKAVEPDSEPE